MNKKSIGLTFLTAAMAIGFTSCEEKTPAEKAADSIEDAAEEVGDAIEDATD